MAKLKPHEGKGQQEDKEIAQYSKKIKNDPKNAELYYLYYNRGLLYAKKGHYNMAIGDYTQAITLKPGYVEAYLQRADAYLSQEKYGLKTQCKFAIQDFRQALKLEPDCAEIYLKLSKVYEKQGNYEKVTAAYEKQENYEKALEAVTQAIKLKPDYAEAYVQRGFVSLLVVQISHISLFYPMPKKEQILQDYTQAIKLKPDYAEAYYKRGCAYYSAYYKRGCAYDSNDKAIQDLTKAIALNPKYGEAYCQLGWILVKRGDSSEGFKNLRKAIELNCAEAYLCCGGISDLTKAIQIKPNNVDAYILRGDYYSSEKQYEKAIQDFTMALQVWPERDITFVQKVIDYSNGPYTMYNRRGDAYYFLAEQYNKSGQKQQAKEYSDKALADYNESKADKWRIERLNKLMENLEPPSVVSYPSTIEQKTSSPAPQASQGVQTPISPISDREQKARVVTPDPAPIPQTPLPPRRNREEERKEPIDNFEIKENPPIHAPQAPTPPAQPMPPPFPSGNWASVAGGRPPVRQAPPSPRRDREDERKKPTGNFEVKENPPIHASQAPTPPAPPGFPGRSGDSAPLRGISPEGHRAVEALAKVRLETLEELSYVKPATMRRLRVGDETAQQVEAEYKQIMGDKALQTYYEYFQRSLNSTITGCLCVYSGIVDDGRNSTAEGVLEFIKDTVQIPFISAPATKAASMLLKQYYDRGRKQEVHNMTGHFPNSVRTGEISEALARHLTLRQKAGIQKVFLSKEASGLAGVKEKIKKAYQWFTVSDIGNGAQELAATQAEKTIEHFMGLKPVQAVQVEDILIHISHILPGLVEAPPVVSSFSVHRVGKQPSEKEQKVEVEEAKLREDIRSAELAQRAEEAAREATQKAEALAKQLELQQEENKKLGGQVQQLKEKQEGHLKAHQAQMESFQERLERQDVGGQVQQLREKQEGHLKAHQVQMESFQERLERQNARIEEEKKENDVMKKKVNHAFGDVINDAGGGLCQVRQVLFERETPASPVGLVDILAKMQEQLSFLAEENRVLKEQVQSFTQSLQEQGEELSILRIHKSGPNQWGNKVNRGRKATHSVDGRH